MSYLPEKILKKVISILTLFCLLIFFAGCNAESNFLLDVTEIVLYNGDKDAAKKEMLDFLYEFEKNVSTNIKSSDVSRINDSKAGIAVEVSAYIIEMLNISVDVYNRTGGAFNPCIYTISKLYNFSKKTIPSDSTIDKLLPFTNINDLIIKDNTVTKKYDDTLIDLGGIAKGYATDKCYEIAKKHNVTSGIIDIGRNIYLIGAKSGNVADENFTPFVVGITDPRPKNNLYFGKINLTEISAVTSGDYERYFIKDNIRYCHILDGKTGKRPESNLISVSIFGGNSTLCDAYSTALFIIGMENAVRFAELNSLKVLLINDKMEYYVSEGLDIYNIRSSYKPYQI